MGRAPARSRRSGVRRRVRARLDGQCAPARPALHVSTRRIRPYCASVNVCADARTSTSSRCTVSDRTTADRAGARPNPGPPQIRARCFETCTPDMAALITQGRAPARSRRQASDGRVPCSALDGQCAPARPALHVSTRHLSFCIRPFPLLRLL